MFLHHFAWTRTVALHMTDWDSLGEFMWILYIPYVVLISMWNHIILLEFILPFFVWYATLNKFDDAYNYIWLIIISLHESTSPQHWINYLMINRFTESGINNISCLSASTSVSVGSQKYQTQSIMILKHFSLFSMRVFNLSHLLSYKSMHIIFFLLLVRLEQTSQICGLGQFLFLSIELNSTKIPTKINKVNHQLKDEYIFSIFRQINKSGMLWSWLSMKRFQSL